MSAINVSAPLIVVETFLILQSGLKHTHCLTLELFSFTSKAKQALYKQSVCIHSMHVFWSVCLYQTKCTRPPLPVQVPDTSLAELWRWMSMETGFLSLILCDLLFIKIKLCVRKHNLFMLRYSYCSTSSLSCINARLCLSYRLRLANSAHFAHLTATFVPNFFSRRWFLPSAVSFNGIYVCVNVLFSVDQLHQIENCIQSIWIISQNKLKVIQFTY